MSKQVELPLDVARKIYQECNKPLKEWILANYTKEELEAKELPKRWKDLSRIDGFYINAIGAVLGYNTGTVVDSNKNTFATQEQAEASVALAQLSQLMAVYNDGWVPNWKDIGEVKYCIHYHNGILIVSGYTQHTHFLRFKTAKLRGEFLENFKDLIEQAKPLL